MTKKHYARRLVALLLAIVMLLSDGAAYASTNGPIIESSKEADTVVLVQTEANQLDGEISLIEDANQVEIIANEEEVVWDISPVTAASYTYADWTYEVLDDDTVSIIGYSGSDTNVVIPSKIKSYPVKVIGNRVFYKNDSIISVIVPEGVDLIEAYAFYGCRVLKEVHFPDSLTRMGYKAFADCKSLSKINYPKNWIAVPPGFGAGTYDHGYAFSGCDSLAEVTISTDVEQIPFHAFSGCTGLRKVVLQEGVTIIDAYAFSDCTNLEEVIMADSITKIAYKAFNNCRSLEKVNYPKNWTLCPTGFGAENGEHGYVFSGCTSLSTISIPTEATVIPLYAFAGCSNLSNVYIPDQVTEIQEGAFRDSPNVIFYCNLCSYAALYAIENDISLSPVGVIEDTSNKVLNRNITDYYGNLNGMTSNGYIPMSVNYGIKDSWMSDVSDMQVKIVLPLNTELVEESLRVDGILCTKYKYDDRRSLIVPVENTSGNIKFSVKVKNPGKITTYAILEFRRNNVSEKEIIGIICEECSVFTIDCPEITSKNTFSVSGVASASSDIVIQVEDSKTVTTKASKAGIWSAELVIDDPKDCYTYEVLAECIHSDGMKDRKKTSVTYLEGEPSVSSLKIYYNEHDRIRQYELLENDTIIPNIYFVPGTKFNFEVAVDHPNQMKELYITSTRNNETKYLEATYDETTNTFKTEGYFDEADHNYVPGTISYEYTKPRKTTLIGDEVDGEQLKVLIPTEAKKAPDIKKQTEKEFEAQIDLSGISKDLADTTLDYSISIFDSLDAVGMSTFAGMLQDTSRISKYIVKDKDGNTYICSVDFSDPNTWYMLINDVANSKFVGTCLNAMDLDDVATELGHAGKIIDWFYKTNEITKDTEALKKEVLSSGKYSYQEYTEKIEPKIDELDRNQKNFVAITTVYSFLAEFIALSMLPVSAAAVLTAYLAVFELASIACFAYRKNVIKGGKFKIKFVIDPSGYVFDMDTAERMEGVKTTAYCIEYDDSADFWKKKPAADQYGKKWNAAEYNQQNPLYTNEDGKYAWDVPEGWWRVKFEKDGYETVWSDWMTVPPIQTEVNIGMKYVGSSETPSMALEAPELTKASNTVAGVKVTWQAVEAAEKYRVLYKKKGDDSWIISGDTTSVTYTVPSGKLTSGQEYYFTVCCISTDGDKVISGQDETGKTLRYLAAVVADDMKLSNTSSGVKLSWKAILGAKGYYIYRKTSADASYTKIGSVTGGDVVTYTDKKATNGKTYTYSVRAYNSKTLGSYKGKSTIRLSSVSISSVTNSSSKKMIVKWSKNTQATGYQIYYGTDKSFAKGTYKSSTIKSAKTVSKTLSSMAKNKTYYVKVRVYKTVDGTKYYSGWSSVKSKKITK